MTRNDKLFIGLMALAVVLTWPLIYFVLPAMGYTLKPWALLTAATVSAIYAGLFVLLCETIIEDLVKTGLFLIITGIIWYQQPRGGFLFICALAAGVIGPVLNQIHRARRKD